MKKTLVGFIVTLLFICSIPAYAGTSLPSINANRPIKCYTLRDDNVQTRDLSTHNLEKGHYTCGSDELWIYQFNNKFCIFSYSVRSGRRKASLKTNELFKANSAIEKFQAKASATTYKRSNLKQKAGNIDFGDNVWLIWKKDSIAQVLYNIGSPSNPSGYRLAFISISVYNSLKNGASKPKKEDPYPSGNRSLECTPEYVERKIRSATIYNRIIDQFEVTLKARYARTAKNTFCNIFGHDCIYAMTNNLLPHWVDSKGNPATSSTKGAKRELTANETASWMKNTGVPRYGWKSVSAEKAQKRANQGYPTIAIWTNPSPKKSGHVMVVRPETSKYKYSKDKSCIIAQAGASNFNYTTVRKVMGSKLSSTLYYTHD